MGKTVMENVSAFKDFVHTRTLILKSMSEWFEKIKKETINAAGNSDVCGEIKQADNSIEFRLMDFNIYIRVDICTSRDVGLIKWFYLRPESDEKITKQLIIKDAFDLSGGIKATVKSKMGYTFDNIMIYCFDTFCQYIEKVDEIKYQEIVK